MYRTFDVLTDIFKFLEKNEQEKSQLVNKYWKRTITNNITLNPRRRLYMLNFTRNYHLSTVNFHNIL